MSLAEKLVALRKQKGLTQMDLAEKLDVSRQAISRWEVGAAVPGTDNLKVLGELFGVSVDYLLNDNQENLSRFTEPLGKGQDSKEDSKNRIKRKAIFVCLLVGAIIFVIITGITKRQEPTRESVVPIENMTVEEDRPDLVKTFPFE